MKTTLATAAAVLIGLSAAAGCHSSAGQDTPGAAGAAASRPTFHATLQWERLNDGKHMARENYAVLEDACKASGKLVRGLAPDEVDKLDTGRVDIWQDARGAYGRQRTWDYVAEQRPDGSCVIRLEESVDDGSQSFRELDGAAMDIPPVDATEVAEMAKLQGFTRVGESQVKGQPCTRWRSDNQEVCSWSGGMAAGISNGPADSPCAGELGPMAYLSPLPLQSRQGAQGLGCNLELVTMTVGKGLLPEVGRAMAELDAAGTGD